MSHVPLLTRQTVPRLQPPRRGPQVLLACMVTAVLLLLLPHGTYAMLAWNATRVYQEPPPPALSRIVNAAEHHEVVTPETLEDLLATVGYLAKRELGPR